MAVSGGSEGANAILIDGEVIEMVNKFVYFVNRVNADSYLDTEVSRCLATSSRVFGYLREPIIL